MNRNMESWENIANLPEEQLAAHMQARLTEAQARTGAEEASGVGESEEASASAAAASPARRVSNNNNWSQPAATATHTPAPRAPVMSTLVFRLPPDHEPLPSDSFFSKFSLAAGNSDVRTYKVPGICEKDFGKLAIELNKKILRPQDLLAQLKRCISIRIHKHNILSSHGNSLKDFVHVQIIVMLTRLYNFLETTLNNPVLQVHRIEWTDIGTGKSKPYGFFTVHHSDRMIGTGGKRKTRRARKSKRKQTRRRR